MVSTGKLRLLSSLNAGSPECFEPTVDDEGRVEYSEAHDILNRGDGTGMEALTSLAERGFLHKEYTTKVYVCPSCQIEGMQYSTACPFCETTHTVRTSFFEHDHCGYTGESTEFEPEDDTDMYQCPDCEREFDSADITIEQKHLCKECGESVESPSHRLWCIDCLHLCPPRKATEQPLYDYELTEKGTQEYETQTTARERLADELDTRGFDVSIDTTVSTDETESYPVHIHAEDDLLSQQIVADIHSTVTSDKLQYISTAAQEIGAQPLLLTPDGSISRETLQIAHQHGVTILWIAQDDSLKRHQSVDDQHRTRSNIVDRLSSAVGLTPKKT